MKRRETLIYSKSNLKEEEETKNLREELFSIGATLKNQTKVIGNWSYIVTLMNEKELKDKRKKKGSGRRVNYQRLENGST